MVAIIGAATAFFAATIGLVQTDIKRVLAYSTVSQLGYMFLGCGVAAYSAAIFHLMTHAFFKALLFLAAGSVIHALGGEQDMRMMGGLTKEMPVTFWTMTMAVFAIAGFPPFAGFFSKDEILDAAFMQPDSLGKMVWFVGLVTALLTSFYMFRLWYLTFFGERRAGAHDSKIMAQPCMRDRYEADDRSEHGHELHESPWSCWGRWSFWRSVDRRWMDRRRDASALIFRRQRGAHRSQRGEQHLELTTLAVALQSLGWFIADCFIARKPERPAGSPKHSRRVQRCCPTSTGWMRFTAR